MRIDCYKCDKVYVVQDEELGPGGLRAVCPICGTKQTVRPEDQLPPNDGAVVLSDEDSDTFGMFGAAPSGDLAAVAPSAPSAAEPPVGPGQGTHSSSGASRAAALATAAPARLTQAGPALSPDGRDPKDVAHEHVEDPFDSFDFPMVEQRPSTSESSGRGDVEPESTVDPEPFAEIPREPSIIVQPDSPIVPAPSEYRLKKADGSILGPIGFARLEEMVEEGILVPGCQVARDSDEYRLLSQYPECRELLERAARRQRATREQSRPSRSRIGRWRVGLAVSGMAVVGAVLLAFLWPMKMPGGIERTIDKVVKRPLGAFNLRSEPALGNPVENDLPLYRLQVMSLGGEPSAHVARARGHMLEDSLVAYLEADLALKAALLVKPDHLDAVGYLVVNTILRAGWTVDTATMQRLVSYSQYLQERAPDHAVSLLARAAVEASLGTGGSGTVVLARRAAEARPEDPLPKLVLARALAAASPDLAIEVLRPLVEEGHAARAHLELAHACAMAGAISCTEGALWDRLAIDWFHPEATSSLVNLLMLVGRDSEARGVYERALVLQPGRVDAALSLSILEYQREGKLTSARRRIDALLAARGESRGDELDHRLRVHAAVLARLAGEHRQARAMLEEVFAVAPHHGPASYQAVLIALERGELDSATALLPAAVAEVDHPYRRFLLRALTQVARGNVEEALRDARRAVDAAPTTLEAALLVIALEARRGGTRQAYAVLRDALQVELLEHSRRRLLTDYYDGALLQKTIDAGLDDLVRRDSAQGMAHAARGLGRWLYVDVAGARDALARALALDPRNVSALTYRGIIELQAGNVRSASSSFEQARAADPLHPMPHYLFGRAAEAANDFEQARRAYDEALRRNQSFYPAEVRLAVLRARSGDTDGAVSRLKSLLSGEGDAMARSALYEIGH